MHRPRTSPIWVFTVQKSSAETGVKAGTKQALLQSNLDHPHLFLLFKPTRDAACLYNREPFWMLTPHYTQQETLNTWQQESLVFISIISFRVQSKSTQSIFFLGSYHEGRPSTQTENCTVSPTNTWWAVVQVQKLTRYFFPPHDRGFWPCLEKADK